MAKGFLNTRLPAEIFQRVICVYVFEKGRPACTRQGKRALVSALIVKTEIKLAMFSVIFIVVRWKLLHI